MTVIIVAALVATLVLGALLFEAARLSWQAHKGHGPEHERDADTMIDDLWALAQKSAEHRDYLYRAFDDLRRGHNER